MKRLVALSGLLAFFLLAGETAQAQEKDQGQEQPPLWSQAERYYDKAAMAEARNAVLAHGGAQGTWMAMADRLELQSGNGADTLLWDMQGWYGGDLDKLWIKSEGDYDFEADKVEEAEVQALWSRAISPYFDLQTGLRYDVEPQGRGYLVLGAQGLAPYWFEADAAVFLSDQGDLTARIELEYDALLTQRLILQPRAELELSAQDVAERRLGAGVTALNAGLRLRYEIARTFAPYVGVEWQNSYGATANYLRREGEDPHRLRWLIGLRAWF